MKLETDIAPEGLISLNSRTEYSDCIDKNIMIYGSVHDIKEVFKVTY